MTTPGDLDKMALMAEMRGVRFAPSPTGRFHLGNLRTAWISWLWARSLGEPWILRFEDIDAPRVVPGAMEGQLEDMRRLGWAPNEVRVQSASRARHWELLQAAIAEGRAYPCVCSRREVQAALAGAASAPHGAMPEYSGHCRPIAEDRARDGAKVQVKAGGSVAWRFKMDEGEGGLDFIIARTSGGRLEFESFVPAYHWACAIDDYDGAYRLLVRAADLEPAARLQWAVQRWLAARKGQTPRLPAVFHAALVVQDDGHRLEKRTAGVTLPELERAGWMPAEIVDRFERSFDRSLLKHPPEPGNFVGEAFATLRLAELGIG